MFTALTGTIPKRSSAVSVDSNSSLLNLIGDRYGARKRQDSECSSDSLSHLSDNQSTCSVRTGSTPYNCSQRSSSFNSRSPYRKIPPPPPSKPRQTSPPNVPPPPPPIPSTTQPTPTTPREPPRPHLPAAAIARQILPSSSPDSDRHYSEPRDFNRVNTVVNLPARGRTKRGRCFLKRRTLVLISAISFVFSVVTTGLFTVMFFSQVNLPWRSQTFPEGSYETCVKCLYLMRDSEDLNNPLIDQLQRKVFGGEDRSLCCARTSGQMSVLIQLVMRQQKNISAIQAAVPNTTFRFSPVSAHRSLSPKPRISRDQGPAFRDGHLAHLQISDDDRDNVHSRNVGVRNNSLSIRYAGWYFVYSSVVFRPDSTKPCKNFRFQTWGHYIVRHSSQQRSKSGCLAKSAHTCCDDCAHDHHSSFTGGVFELLPQDQIFVEVSGEGLIRFDGNGSYLGLVMLGSADNRAPNTDKGIHPFSASVPHVEHNINMP